jgi:hypothetical protein
VNYLSVKNFEHFQHYKDRAPTWIKLYNAVMDDEAFLDLTDAERGQLVLIWLLASRRDNRIPNDGKAIARAIQASGRVNVERFVTAGFLVPYQSASDVLAEPEQDASPHAGPRARGEGEKRREETKRGEKSAATAGADKPPARPPRPTWVTDGVALWTTLVGTIPLEQFGQALKPIVHLHGWPAVRADLEKWARARIARGQACNPTWYAKEASARLAPKPPLVDEHGQLTEYGERMSRPGAIPA